MGGKLFRGSVIKLSNNLKARLNTKTVKTINMKKLAITISLLAGATAGYTQGVLNWSDYDGALNGLPAYSITIWSAPATGAEQNLGNTSIDLPAGNATYSGTPLSGTGFSIGLYVASTASGVQNAVTSGTPVTTDSFAAGSGGWDFSGSLDATVPGLPSGSAVFVELAAWANSGTAGAATSYAQAIADHYAAGDSFTSSGTTTLGGAGSPPATPGTLAGIGLTDFSLGTTPEPSTIALGVIGASAFLMRLRRKQ
jgi:hypothetical protein